MRGRSQWLSAGQPMHYEMCQAIVEILSIERQSEGISTRAEKVLDDLQEEFAWLEQGKTTLLIDANGNAHWWTFAGRLLNAAFAETLAVEADKISADNLCITFSHIYDADVLASRIRELIAGSSSDISLSLEEDFVQELKFAECMAQMEIDKEILARYSLEKDFEKFNKKELAILHLF